MFSTGRFVSYGITFLINWKHNHIVSNNYEAKIRQNIVAFLLKIIGFFSVVPILFIQMKLLLQIL